MTKANQIDDVWTSAWLDLVAFISVLALAWWSRASAVDLVWSLWLSSLVVGYTIILWAIVRPTLEIAAHAWRDRAQVKQALASTSRSTTAIVGALGVLGGLFVLAFFTVHFVGFHYVHAWILAAFLPLSGEWGSRSPQMYDVAMFREIVGRYWWYLPAAFLAERAVFLRPASVSPKGQAMTMLPYRKVMRMHALIFFFGIAHLAGLDNFAVYAVVYAVYFFPWRLVNRSVETMPVTPAREPG